MTALTEISEGHFSGQAATTGQRSGDDPRSLETMIRELQQESNKGAIVSLVDDRAVAATETITADIAPADGEIVAANAYPQVTAAAAESMTVDVMINGVTALTGVITMDNASGIAVVAGVLDSAAVEFSAGDKITVVRTYTAGGGPTPMSSVAVSVGVRYSE